MCDWSFPVTLGWFWTALVRPYRRQRPVDRSGACPHPSQFRAHAVDRRNHGSLNVHDAASCQHRPRPHRGRDPHHPQLLGRFEGSLALRLWNDVTHSFGQCADRVAPSFTLVLRDPSVLRDLVLKRGPIPLADAYFHGRLDVEGDLYAALGLKHHFQNLSLSGRERAGLLLDALRLAFTPASEDRARGLRAHHAPVHARPLAGERPGRDLAPLRRLERFLQAVARRAHGVLLRVLPCGRRHAGGRADPQARTHLPQVAPEARRKNARCRLWLGRAGDARCTSSRCAGDRHHAKPRSIRVGAPRVREEKLEDRVTIELVDYRDVPGGCFDKVSSVGMFEHVGLKNLPTYFNTVRRLLKPSGLFLNHGITHDEEGWHKQCRPISSIAMYSPMANWIR